MSKHFTVLLIITFFTACNKSEIITKTLKSDNVISCSQESKECPDGRSVNRNPDKNCKFNACISKPVKAAPMMCTADTRQCSDGSYVGRDYYNHCKFKECPPTNNGRNLK